MLDISTTNPDISIDKPPPLTYIREQEKDRVKYIVDIDKEDYDNKYWIEDRFKILDKRF